MDFHRNEAGRLVCGRCGRVACGHDDDRQADWITGDGGCGHICETCDWERRTESMRPNESKEGT